VLEARYDSLMKVDEIARRHGFSAEAATVAMRAVEAGRGMMAQFDHHELGGAGQWMRGGMIMLSDMGNVALRRRVDALFTDLSEIASLAPRVDGPRGSSEAWWPGALGTPASTGGQNDVRYAYFPDRRRLAIAMNGAVTVYDTLDHRIGGFGQQQGGTSRVTFTSDHGNVDVGMLPVANPDDLE